MNQETPGPNQSDESKIIQRRNTLQLMSIAWLLIFCFMVINFVILILNHTTGFLLGVPLIVCIIFVVVIYPNKLRTQKIQWGVENNLGWTYEEPRIRKVIAESRLDQSIYGYQDDL
jgi:membrane protein YdbS with pleckstrin-like domain